jgi:hypothetical protein
VELHSGKRVKIGGLDLGAVHRVDDGYETDYEPQLPQQPRRRLPRWLARYGDEAGYRWLAAERLERWRQAAGPVAVAIRPPSLLTVGGSVPTFAAAVTSDAAPNVDVWQVMHDQGLNPEAGRRFLESWEVPS